MFVNVDPYVLLAFITTEASRDARVCAVSVGQLRSQLAPVPEKNASVSTVTKSLHGFEFFDSRIAPDTIGPAELYTSFHALSVNFNDLTGRFLALEEHDSFDE